MKPLFALGSGFPTRSSERFCDRGILVSMEPFDKAAIFKELCCHNRIWREAPLPVLDLKTEYRFAVAVAAQRRTIHKQYEPNIRAEILSRMRAIHGATWPNDLGGRYRFGALVDKLLFELHGP